jgi:protein-S-isoprenylcysteine O-methyltransferase Ste14
MKLMSNWGFSPDSWKGQHGEYWVVMQAVVMLGYVVLPVYRPNWLVVSPPWLYGIWALSGLLFVGAAILVGRGLVDLGSSLTPLPYPRQDGQFIQSGIYAIVRHPLYSGVTLAAKAYAIGQLSLSHFAAMLLLFAFFNFKAHQEEIWLSEKYPEYASYRQQVKKLIPWVY